MSSAVYTTSGEPLIACDPTTPKGSRLSAALLMTQSDSRLMSLASEGCERAFDTLVRRYRGPLQRYAQRFLPGALAEDAAQQAFLDLWAALAEGHEIREVRPWLYRVVRNGALNTIRRAGYRSDPLDEPAGGVDSPEAVFERRSAVRETFAGMTRLPAQQREAILLSAVDGHSRAQIAMAMGVSDGAVGQLLHRARTSLRGALAAIVPLPLLAWMAAGRRFGASSNARLLEATSNGGGAAEMLIKGAAAAAVVAVAATPILVAPSQGQGQRTGSARPAPTSVAASWVPRQLTSDAFAGAIIGLRPASPREHSNAPVSLAPPRGAVSPPTVAPAAEAGATPVASAAEAPSEPAATAAQSAEPAPPAEAAPIQPPAESPPAESPPAESPPAETPLAEAPPAEAPPVEFPPAEAPAPEPTP
jgi:RNA polymerase sigma factor (sigma-70 family)